ncbi:MAG: xanthine dehydrogenase family protein molybdopterin-binding subunit [Hyphomicrobiales bacterium]|nr:xanthine dehydrogenase family protein molybdopterin-binding subunit [Hyphomicrobiales bacterium]
MSIRIGSDVRRKEDLRLITGAGCFSDDVNLPDQAYAAMVRSPHAHALIRVIETGRARAADGVLAVLTGADLLIDGLKPIPHRPALKGAPDIALRNRDGSEPIITPHYPLPADKVRFAGEAVAMVVATSLSAAKAAAELVAVAYEPLAAVTRAMAAAAPDAPSVSGNGTNICVDADAGDAVATKAAFERAAHIVALDTQVQRVTGVPLEPRAAVGAYDARAGRYTLHAGSGNVVRQKAELAAILGVSEASVRVIARDVGGNFGTRNAFYPEFALVCWASRRLGRPVKWTCERSESFLSDYQGRDLSVQAELALDATGRFLALRGTNTSNVGAHTVSFVALVKGLELMSSVYRIPAAHFCGRAVTTNTPPTNSYRSAGRPEAMFVIERLIDIAAMQCGFDRIALRRRNLVPERPRAYVNPLGLSCDGGGYKKAMDTALRLADWQGFARRRREARRNGKLRGIGVANYIELTSGIPRERAEITIALNGFIDVVIGTLSSGQGHETSFAQLVTEWLGVPFERVRLITGDTDTVQAGGGSHSGRSMRMAGIVIGNATRDIVAKARRIVAHIVETGTRDVEFKDGRFHVQDRSFDLFEVASAAITRNDLPDDLRGPLTGVSDVTYSGGGFPFGTHVCEVEVDPDTGAVALVSYAALDDVGRAVNPLILHGQAHGGIAQGVGQALGEVCCYDPGSGQLLSGSFMDYAIPRADTLPSFSTEIGETPSPLNPLGIRSGGEGGTTPALAVVMNAIVDALSEFGVRHIEMPATPERIWRAIDAARRAQSNAATKGVTA